MLAALFAALIAVGGLVALPFWGPVPFTLQVFFVLLAGLVQRVMVHAAEIYAEPFAFCHPISPNPDKPEPYKFGTTKTQRH